MSCVSMMSFTPNGRPLSGPRDPSRARDRASAPRASARSGSSMDERVHDGIARGDALEAGARQRLGGEPPGGHRRQRFDCSQFVRAFAPSRMSPASSLRSGVPYANNSGQVFAVAAVATATQGECGSWVSIDVASSERWRQARSRSSWPAPCDRARAIGAAPRAAGGSQDPRHRPDDEQHHQQSRLHDLRHAVLAGQQARAEAADGRELHARAPTASTWTFKLRPGLKFHDGQPVTSKDVVASILRFSQAHPGRRDDDAVHQGDRRHRSRHASRSASTSRSAWCSRRWPVRRIRCSSRARPMRWAIRTRRSPRRSAPARSSSCARNGCRAARSSTRRIPTTSRAPIRRTASPAPSSPRSIASSGW